MNQLELNTIYRGDCLKIMQDIENHSVDCILCDLPYGTTRAAWDVIIPFDALWDQYKRVIKENGVIILTHRNLFYEQQCEIREYFWLFTSLCG